jgi:hypothetical protein
VVAQSVIKRENGTWSLFKDGKKISPSYDTIYDFDPTGKVCLGCHKRRTQLPNKLIKVFTTSYSCNYLNNKGTRLQIKMPGNDTCSVFGLTKSSVASKNEPEAFAVSVNNRRYLVSKDFRQLTFKGHHDIHGSGVSGFYIAEELNDAETPFTGIISNQETVIVPFKYSSIKVNTEDSLIIACSAGVRANADDELLNYKGQRLYAFKKHIEQATKLFAVLKVFEPQEGYYIYNFTTKQEMPLPAEEVKLYRDQQILIRIKRDWYLYDIVTAKKSLFKTVKDEKN